MAKIKQLSATEAQKIAAGEVVERPANVVKELIENSLDAGASEITLYIEEGGKKLIHIIDNGCGMSLEDARMCIKHHATSKITSISDLENISTFGFRGEALSSISSVSQIKLTTKEEHANSGVTLIINEGIIEKETVTACNTGTEIAIHDLFYNVPARKKFLKAKETEWRAIVQLFYAFALDYTDVNFKIYHENKLIHNCPSAPDLATRLSQLYEQTLANNILLIESKEDRMRLSIKGAITDPQYTRYDRNQIFLFVNNRWVKNHKLAQALVKGYQNMLQPEKYPAGFIFINLDSQYVDINVHPRKEEVQFLHPKIVESLIESTVKNKLENYASRRLGINNINSYQTLNSRPKEEQADINISPEKSNNINNINKKTEINQSFLNQRINNTPKPEYNYTDEPFNILQKANNLNSIDQKLWQRNYEANLQENIEINNKKDKEEFSKILETNFSLNSQNSDNGASNKASETPRDINLDNNPKNISGNINLRQDIIAQKESSSGDITETINTNIETNINSFDYRLIGQIHLTYIIIETAEGITLIDQHAAHERVLYEKIKSKFIDMSPVKLLFAHILTLNRDDINIIEPYLYLFAQFGLIIEKVSDNQLALTQTPVFLKNRSIDDLIKQCISWAHENNQIAPEQLREIIDQNLHAQVSCKAAVKAGDELTQESMNNIIKDLYNCATKLTCPHGRPTMWPLNINEIEKKFKRDYKSASILFKI